MPFAGHSNLTLSNGTEIQLTSKFVSNGTLPVGSTWQVMPIPSTSQLGKQPKGIPQTAFQFEPPCYEPVLPTGLTQGRCSGEWTPNITIHDTLRIPEGLAPGEYVLGLRYDCEASAQVWASCADILVTA